MGCIIALALIFAVTYWQYNSTFLATYVETGTRRITLAEKLRKIPLSFFGKKDLADLTSTIMADCTYLETAFSHFIPPFIGAMISTVVIAISLFFFDWRMAIASLWVLPVAFAIIGLSSKVQKSLNRKSMDAKMVCADGIQECIETIQDLKANNAEQSYMAGLDTKIDNVEKRSIINEFGTSTFVVSAGLVLKLGIATTALVGSILLVNGQLDVLTFFMFLLVVSRLYDPMQSALQNLAAIISTNTNVARMNEILDHDVQTGNTRLTNKGYDVKFKNVEFSYNNKDNVLKDVSFTAKQGEVTALIGPSGGGKTTVSRLAARFWDINKGKITVGGMDISKIEPETLLSLYSIVFQDVTLFNNTIMENIRLGKKDATDEEIYRALEIAQAKEFVDEKKQGLDMKINQGGKNLSGGQRQRLTIARALVRSPQILIMDDSASALDFATDARLRRAIREHTEGMTVFIISQRASAVKQADTILVLDDGRLAGKGTHSQLMESCEVYREICLSQLSKRGGAVRWERMAIRNLKENPSLYPPI